MRSLFRKTFNRCVAIIEHGAKRKELGKHEQVLINLIFFSALPFWEDVFGHVSEEYVILFT